MSVQQTDLQAVDYLEVQALVKAFGDAVIPQAVGHRHHFRAAGT